MMGSFPISGDTTYWVLFDPESEKYPYYFTYYLHKTYPGMRFVQSAGNAGVFITKQMALEEKTRLLDHITLSEEDVEVAKRLVPQKIRETIRAHYEVLE